MTTTAPPRCSAWPSARSARSWSSARSPPSPSSSTGDAGDAEPYRRAWRHGGQAAGSGVVSCSATGGGRPHPSDREHGRDRLLYLHDRSGCLVWQDRKSTRLNSSHVKISYAVFCLKKKKNTK